MSHDHVRCTDISGSADLVGCADLVESAGFADNDDLVGYAALVQCMILSTVLILWDMLILYNVWFCRQCWPCRMHLSCRNCWSRRKCSSCGFQSTSVNFSWNRSNVKNIEALFSGESLAPTRIPAYSNEAFGLPLFQVVFILFISCYIFLICDYYYLRIKILFKCHRVYQCSFMLQRMVKANVSACIDVGQFVVRSVECISDLSHSFYFEKTADPAI